MSSPAFACLLDVTGNLQQVVSHEGDEGCYILCCMLFRSCHYMNFPLAIAIHCSFFLVPPLPFLLFPPILVFKKEMLLSQAVVACLESLVEYLYVKNQDAGNVFLLFLLLDFPPAVVLSSLISIQ